MKCKFCGAEVELGAECKYCGSRAEASYYKTQPQENPPEMRVERKPRTEEKYAPAYRVEGGKYTVQKGDTLWGIAKALLGKGSRYKEIARLNNIKNADLIYPGQELIINGLQDRVFKETLRQAEMHGIIIDNPKKRNDIGVLISIHHN